MKIKVKKLHEDAQLPTYGSDGAACFDLYAHNFKRRSTNSAVIGTGLAFEIPEGYEMLIRPRSGLAFKKGIHGFAGTVDSDYRGEVKVLLFSDIDGEYANFKKDQRIAQAVIRPVMRVEFDQVDELSDTVRGSGGFGSTGSK